VARPSPFPGAPVGTPSSIERHSPVETNVLVQTALGLKGVRYRLGGDEPAGGFDCSGLVRYVFQRHRLEMPRTVAEQYSIGRRVTTRDIRPGDLVFFSTTGRGATHVGIATGSGEFVHAPGTGAVVRTDRYDAPYWRARMVGVRRAL
jgi:cell wall-associated NlpC family hydrolase